MADLFAPRKPTTWLELRLGGYLVRLCVSLVAYFATLFAFWCRILGVTVFPIGVSLSIIYVGIANYVFLTWTAYRIQSKLHEAD
ncbi:hypothetical protein ACO0LM_26895 [Undibacterium sp. Di26W]|uniref:hypothetical protein n=1 Tax=Undibacterium sp. Di26W TaxID=3413035 RepID=UPI003BEFC7A6